MTRYPAGFGAAQRRRENASDPRYEDPVEGVNGRRCEECGEILPYDFCRAWCNTGEWVEYADCEEEVCTGCARPCSDGRECGGEYFCLSCLEGSDAAEEWVCYPCDRRRQREERIDLANAKILEATGCLQNAKLELVVKASSPTRVRRWLEDAERFIDEADQALAASEREQKGVAA